MNRQQNELSAPITLDNGRIVIHKPMPNGAQEALMQDGGEMSNAEWLEYCDRNLERALNWTRPQQ